MSQAEEVLSVQLEQAGIPFQREFKFAASLGRRWRSDFMLYTPRNGLGLSNGAWLLVEIDGGAYVAGRHTRGAGFEKDAEKASAAAILGYRVIRCTPAQVEDGRALSWIRQALGLTERAA